MPVNVKLLKKVRKLIAEEPRRLAMNDWGHKISAGLPVPAPPPCGTVACLAGWTLLAAQPKRQWNQLFSDGWLYFEGNRYKIGKEAARLLGMEVGDCPFYQVTWGPREVLAWIDRQIDAASK